MIRLEVAGTDPSGDSYNVLIRNLSTTGLLLETSENLTLGQEVSVELPHCGEATVRIVWASGTLFGGQFEREISAATLSAAELLSPGQSPSSEITEAYPDHRTLGARLRASRQSKGMRVADLAEILEVSKPTIYGWEGDKVVPRQDNLRGLEKALGISLVKMTGNAPEEGPAERSLEVCEPSNEASENFVWVSNRIGRSVSHDSRLHQLIEASKDQIAALAGTSSERVTIILEF